MCEVFRFGGYENVLIEQDHFLYVCREPFNRAAFWAVNEYHYNGVQLRRYDASGADYEYLSNLDDAPDDIAALIIYDDWYRAAYFDRQTRRDYAQDYELAYGGAPDAEEVNEYMDEWARDYAASKLYEYGLRGSNEQL